LLPIVVSACHGGAPFEFHDGQVPGCETVSCKPAAQVGLGIGYACALLPSGAVRCWGRGEYGVLGGASPDGIADPSLAPLLDFGTSRRVIQIAVGWHHACVLFEDHRARCWGQNADGQLGRGDTEDYGDDPHEALAALPDLPLERITRISAGVHGTCAIASAASGLPGQVHCWGSDQGGALGDRSSGAFGDDEPIDALRPVALPADAVAVAAGLDLGCALLDTGAVHCWGDNAAKTLGIGDSMCDIGDERPCVSEQGRVPDIPVSGLGTRTVVALEVNQTSACVVDNTGALLCWGRNSESRLGYPELTLGDSLGAPPGPVSLGTKIVTVAVALGVRHACVLDTEGRVRCYGEKGPALGYGMASETGIAGIGGIQTPAEAYAQRDDAGVVDVGDFDGEPGVDRVKALAAGLDSTCARLVNGDVRCWGVNEYGELGYGDPRQIGAIGDDASPGGEYERLGRPSVLGVE
jgi:alpha-tubulin suppressor-like RCC1 family protein